MLYELEPSSNTTQKSSTVTSKWKVSNNVTENKSSGVNNNIKSVKDVLNGIAFTSDKVYGPELPPGRIEKGKNGNSSNLNGSSILDSPPTSSESDSDVDNNVILLSYNRQSLDSDRDTPCSSTYNSKTPLKVWNKSDTTNRFANVSNVTQASVSPKQSENQFIKIKKPLVPYESDDSSSSEDSNQFTGDKDSRVSTKAAVGKINLCLLWYY